MPSKTRTPLYITSESGNRFILADDEAQALAFLVDDQGPDHGSRLLFSGWMLNVGWDSDSYDSREQFEAESGYDSWWEGVQATDDDKPTEALRRAYEVCPA